MNFLTLIKIFIMQEVEAYKSFPNRREKLSEWKARELSRCFKVQWRFADLNNFTSRCFLLSKNFHDIEKILIKFLFHHLYSIQCNVLFCCVFQSIFLSSTRSTFTKIWIIISFLPQIKKWLLNATRAVAWLIIQIINWLKR